MIETMKAGGNERRVSGGRMREVTDVLFEAPDKLVESGDLMPVLAKGLSARAPEYIAPEASVLEAYERGELPIEQLPFYVNELPQVRSEYDVDALVALARAIETCEDDEPYIDLIHDLDVLEYDNADDLQRYLDHHQLYHGYETPIAIESLVRRPDGTWRLLNCGHRRNRACRIVADSHGYVLKDDDVPQQIHHNLSFERAIIRQGRENEHERVSPEDMANDIAKHQRFFTHRFGRTPTHVELSRISGYTPDRISAALRFYSLPEEVKGFYRQDLINYTIAVECYRLIEAAKKYYVRKYPERYGAGIEGGSATLQQVAHDVTLARLNIFMTDSMKGVSAEKKHDVILAKIRELTNGSTYITDELFELEDGADDPERQRRVSGARLGKYATEVILNRIERGEADEHEMAQYAAIVEALALAQTRAEAERLLLDTQYPLV
jgi:hypothetical protein